MRIVDAAAAADRFVAVCHVYRYSHLFAALHRVIESGDLGDVVSIQLAENVAFWHYAHSYVRGHTRRSTVPWLLQKSCHDLDLLAWMAGSRGRDGLVVPPPDRADARTTRPRVRPSTASRAARTSDTCPYDAVATYRDLDAGAGATWRWRNVPSGSGRARRGCGRCARS